MDTKENRETRKQSRQTELLTDLPLATEQAEEAKAGTGTHGAGGGGGAGKGRCCINSEGCGKADMFSL